MLSTMHTVASICFQRICTWYAHTNGKARVPIEKLITKDSLTSPIMNLKETYIQLQDLVASLSSYIDDEALIFSINGRVIRFTIGGSLGFVCRFFG